MPAMKRRFTRSGLALGPRAPARKTYRQGSYRPARGRAGYSTVARSRGWAATVSEMKYFDTFKDGTALTAPATWAGTEVDPATILTFCDPVKGTGISNRIGRHIKIHAIKIRGQISCAAQLNQTATDAASQVRLVLVLDQQTNAAQMQGEQVFEDPGTASPNNTIQTYMNLDNLGRFRVLKDKMLVIQNPNIAWDGTNMEQNGLVRMFKLNHKFAKPLDVHFNATDGGTVADIVDNSIHMLACASSIALVPQILYEARVSYKDV